MEFEKFEMPKIETISGSEKGSIFVIIAKNKGLKMGIRVFLSPYPIKESNWVVLAFRLRVEADGFSVNSEMAQQNFGEFPFYESHSHASALGIVPLVALPCSPAEVYNHYTSFDGALEQNIIDQIKEKFGKTGAALCLDEEIILETLREKIKDLIPESSVTINDNPLPLWINPDKQKPE